MLIEPGLIATEFGNTVSHTLGETLHDDSVYAAGSKRMDAMIDSMYKNKLMSVGPIAIAKTSATKKPAARPGFHSVWKSRVSRGHTQFQHLLT